MPLEAEAGCPCRSRPARLWRRIERVIRPGLRYDLSQPPTVETTLLVRPDLDNLTAGDLVQLGDLARHLDGGMKVELAFDDAEIEPNGYRLRDTSWPEYCPMPEMDSDNVNRLVRKVVEQVRDHDQVLEHRGELGPLQQELHTDQRRGDDVHGVLSSINKLYRRLERHWIFYTVGRQVVTENERKIAER